MPHAAFTVNGVYRTLLHAALVSTVLLAGCATPKATSTPTSTVIPPTLTPSPTGTLTPIPPTSTPTEIPASPLFGRWSGTAKNGDFTTQVKLAMKSTCLVGQVCGSISLIDVPCSASFTLLSEQGYLYEFKAGNFVGSCAVGQDFLELLPDGTIQYTSKGDYGETSGILSKSSAAVRTVIFDDDGSPDGTTALLYLLSRDDVEIKGVGISYGEAHPQTYIQHIGRMMEDFGFPAVPLGAGLDDSLSETRGFPEWLRRNADNFWGWPIPLPDKTYPVEDEADMLIRILRNADAPVDLFFSGPVTNLARAFRHAPDIREDIGTLYMMAGAVYVPGNLKDFDKWTKNTYADWNPYSDPVAYQEVFDQGLKMVLVPLDATNQLAVTTEDTATWRSGGRVANFVADVYDGLMTNEAKNTYIWDLMAATIMTEPELCQNKDLHLVVITDKGENIGQTKVVSGTPNITVCLKPDVEGIKQTLTEVFSISR